MIHGTSTDELIAAHVAAIHADQHLVGREDCMARAYEAAIPAAIDALYTTRDLGGNMHEAGAAAAVAALRAVGR